MMSRKPYVRKVPNTWWMHNLRYQKYMARECSVVFLAIYTVIIVVGIIRLSQGSEAYNGWLDVLSSPFSIIFHVVALIAVGYHMVTWFEAAPKAMAVKLRGEKVPAETIIKAQYAAWAVVSVVLIILAVVV